MEIQPIQSHFASYNHPHNILFLERGDFALNPSHLFNLPHGFIKSTILEWQPTFPNGEYFKAVIPYYVNWKLKLSDPPCFAYTSINQWFPQMTKK